VWQEGGNRIVFDLKVLPKTKKLEMVKAELAKEMAGQPVELSLDGDDVFLRGTVDTATAANRAVAIASLLGKPINLLHIKVPGVEPQILIKVRFADVDRAASSELGVNIVNLGALNTTGGTSTQAFSPPQYSSGAGGTGDRFSFTDILNIFLFRQDLNLAATIKALEARRMLQILAEPNVLALNGKTASFLAGGEFPYPTLQGGGGGLGAVTIQFREFGIRINFTPQLTPRGTLRLQVTPEVSSLDFANGLTFQGFTIPGLATRRVSTEIELENNQSFAIGGLMDNRLTETYSKIPGIGDLPILGKLFRSRTVNRNNSELLVLVTPEFVRPIPEGMERPAIKMPKEFLPGPTVMPRTPGIDKTGPVPVQASKQSLPHEEFQAAEKVTPTTAQPGSPGMIQFVPVPVAPTPAPAPKPEAPAPARAPEAGGKGGV
jgi:pilus assembly protein CpaC